MRQGEHQMSGGAQREVTLLQDVSRVTRKTERRAADQKSANRRADAESGALHHTAEITAADPYEKVDLFETKIIRRFERTAGTA